MSAVVVARLTIAALVAVGAACHKPTRLPPPVTIQTPALPEAPPWQPTLAVVRAAVDSGQYARADSVLAAFQLEFPQSTEADESGFWRALLQTDTRNPAFAVDRARAAIERYLERPEAARRAEAQIVAQMLRVIDSLRTAHASLRTMTELRDRTRDDEMQKIRDELQRTKDELDRIKRRLGRPKP